MNYGTRYLSIYRQSFGMTYNATQESTWCWLTAQHISSSTCPHTPGMTHQARASHYTRDIDPKCFMDDRRIRLYTLSPVQR